MRRGFWLLAGAALGVAGYRRASRLARALTGQSRPVRLLTGMSQPPSARARPTAGFIRDVREGMAEYWDLHRAQLHRTLGSRSDRTMSGDSQRAHREP
jgi:hypothetical protein